MDYIQINYILIVTGISIFAVMMAIFFILTINSKIETEKNQNKIDAETNKNERDKLKIAWEQLEIEKQKWFIKINIGEEFMKNKKFN